MPNTSNAVVADKGEVKVGAEKASERVAEKRRALGRGLESLLPGPRVVTPGSDPAHSERTNSAAGPVREPISSSSPLSSSLVSSSTSPRIDSGDKGGRAGATVAPSGGVDLQAAAGRSMDGEQVLQLEIERIEENPYQTRRGFAEAALKELADSIRVQGVVQPIVVRPGEEGRFTLILGERRLRASKLAGKTTVPAIVKRVSEQQAAEMTVVENLQRQDLNCVEQAEAFANLSKGFHLTQEQIGARVGLSRETVANYLRLLTLSDGIVGALQKGLLSYSHARALLMVENTEHRWKLAQRVMEQKMSVARLEDLVHGMVMPGGAQKEGGARWVDPNVKAAQRMIETALGVRVRIRDRNGKGKIVIEYSTLEDFDRVVRMLKG